MIDHKHPAVKAAQIGALGRPHHTLDAYANALKAALPHLTADDLRHTPAGRALMAEAWVVGKFDGAKVCEADHFHHPAKPCTPNPYKETPDE